MELIRGWNTVPFDLVLSVNGDDPNVVADEAREAISAHYPEFDMVERLTCHGLSGGELHGPMLKGTTDPETFESIFGSEVQRGISCSWLPSPIPFGHHVKWYERGSLIVPRNLTDLVCDVNISRPIYGDVHQIVDWKRPEGHPY